jgi:DNA-binding NarL/FixJ family response regulator
MPREVSEGQAGARASWRPDPVDLEVLSLLAEGLTVDAVARRQGVSERTVRRRLRAIADEIGVDSTIEAVVHAVRSRLI